MVEGNQQEKEGLDNNRQPQEPKRTPDTSENIRRKKVKWPNNKSKSEWQQFDEDVDAILNTTLAGNIDRKIESMTSFIYNIGMDRFGADEKEVITTSLTKEQIPKDFAKKFSAFLAETLDKPIEKITLVIFFSEDNSSKITQKITVVITCDALVCNAGDESPFMLISIISIARFNEKDNPGYTDKITTFVKEETKLPGNKVQIVYTDLQPHMAGKGK
ncbi:unnamed protein product [Mytilus edulis]|uniref:D-dopachrome decarboxylase n=1 Tax=Mytilus edulis TaxID=6550 RepID=A0A8S3T594_MYTED|nr:unnamed protein product [Mytilus edulis]